SSYNLKPVGSGPFTVIKVKQGANGFIQSIDLQSNRKYYGAPSFLSALSFRFFNTIDDLSNSAKAGGVNGFSSTAIDQQTLQAIQGWAPGAHFKEYSFSLPRYFAVFFNTQKTSLFADPNVRKAMSQAVNK